MGKYWNNEWVDEVRSFLEPVTGPIVPEYLFNDEGSVMLKQEEGDPAMTVFRDKRRIVRYDFSLFTRCSGRGSADRKRAADRLVAAAEKCEKENPSDTSRIELRSFPTLFNRNASGNEEYRAAFSYYRLTGKEEEG